MAKKEEKETIESRLFWDRIRRPRRKAKPAAEKKLGSIDHVAAPVRRKAVPGGVKKKLHWLEIATRLIIFFAILGLLISLYMTWLHFKPEGRSFCSLSEQWDCDAVNKSSYAEIAGVPVALIGAVGYFLFVVVGIAFLLGYEWRRMWRRLRAKHINMLIISLAVLGFLFSVYLSIVQGFVLDTWCIMCIASFVVITIILGLSVWSYSYCARCREEIRSKGGNAEQICRYC